MGAQSLPAGSYLCGATEPRIDEHNVPERPSRNDGPREPGHRRGGVPVRTAGKRLHSLSRKAAGFDRYRVIAYDCTRA